VIVVASSLAEVLADAGRLQQRWQLAAARDVLTAVLTTAVFTGTAGSADRLAVVTGRRMLAEVLRDLGEVDEAYAVAQPLAVECERRLGAGHPATARALTVLATVVHARGDLTVARELYEQVLDGRFREDGPAGRAVRLARAHLALLHRDRADDGGEVEAARAALDAAHKSLRRAYGIADPDTIRFGVALARMYRQVGDDATARRILTVAKAGSQAGLEPWHPLRLLVSRELGEPEPAPAGESGVVLPAPAGEAGEAGRAGEAGVAEPGGQVAEPGGQVAEHPATPAAPDAAAVERGPDGAAVEREAVAAAPRPAAAQATGLRDGMGAEPAGRPAGGPAGHQVAQAETNPGPTPVPPVAGPAERKRMPVDAVPRHRRGARRRVLLLVVAVVAVLVAVAVVTAVVTGYLPLPIRP
jgi:hypothetical protein